MRPCKNEKKNITYFKNLVSRWRSFCIQDGVGEICVRACPHDGPSAMMDLSEATHLVKYGTFTERKASDTRNPTPQFLVCQIPGPTSDPPPLKKKKRSIEYPTLRHIVVPPWHNTCLWVRCYRHVEPSTGRPQLSSLRNALDSLKFEANSSNRPYFL